MLHQNVGLRTAAPFDELQRTTIPIHLLFPTQAKARAERFGPYQLNVASDAVPDRDTLSLVVLSHGNGGSPWTLRGLATHLARKGYVACLPEHVGNSRSDNSLAGTAANLENRPRHITMAIDAAFADPELGPRLAPGKAAVVGVSIGGYGALAVAGGEPWCGAHESVEGKARPFHIAHDPRVCALVLLAPATDWFQPEGSLRGVNVPILLLTGDEDQITPPAHGDRVFHGVDERTRVTRKVVPGAGHFSFLSPFPEEMAGPAFPASQDPPGFNREAYQAELEHDVTAFLKGVLP